MQSKPKGEVLRTLGIPEAFLVSPKHKRREIVDSPFACASG